MKYIILFLLPSVALSQQKKDTKILVAIADTTNILNKISAVLFENGYTIEEKNDQLKHFVTKRKTLKQSSTDLVLRILVKDSIVVMTGVMYSIGNF